MGEVAGAVVAMSLVLIAVFVPVAFFSGTTGPSVPAVLADHRLLGRHLGVQRADAVAGAGRAADAGRARGRSGALRRVPRGSTGRSMAARARYGGRSAGSCGHLRWARAGVRGRAGADRDLVFRSVPSGFVPDEDQNYFIIQAIGPQGASLEYMTGIAKQVEAQLRDPPRGPDIFSVLGFSFSGNGAEPGHDLRAA